MQDEESYLHSQQLKILSPVFLQLIGLYHLMNIILPIQPVKHFFKAPMQITWLSLKKKKKKYKCGLPKIVLKHVRECSSNLHQPYG